MTPAPATYYMPASRLTDLDGDGAGEFRARIEWEEKAASFSILDCFEHSLRRSRRLLLSIDGQLELLTAEGSILRQAAQRDLRFVPDMEQGAVKDALAELSPLRALLPIASGEIRTGMLALIDDEGKTCARAVLKRLEPVDGNAVALLAPRGLRGYDQALYSLTALVRSHGAAPLTAGNLYSMIDHTNGHFVTRPSVEIGRDDTAFDAATRLIAAYLSAARANEAGIAEDIDTEFLHDYRIALRKIRSVLSLFRDVYDASQTLELKTRFSALMAPSGPLRDLDVYLLEQQSFYDLVPDAMHGGLDAMFALIRLRRADEHRRLAAHLQTRAYEKEIKALSKLFSKKRKLLPGANASRSSHDLARELIWRRYRKIRRIASGLTADTPDAEVHRLRIECKKLRYLMEFFAPVFPEEPFQELLKPLKRLQDALGLFNDRSVQQHNLQAFVKSLGDEPRRLEIAQSAGALITVLHQHQIALRDKILDAFARFNSDRTHRTFRVLFGKDS